MWVVVSFLSVNFINKKVQTKATVNPMWNAIEKKRKAKKYLYSVLVLSQVSKYYLLIMTAMLVKVIVMVTVTDGSWMMITEHRDDIDASGYVVSRSHPISPIDLALALALALALVLGLSSCAFLSPTAPPPLERTFFWLYLKYDFSSFFSLFDILSVSFCFLFPSFWLCGKLRY